MSSAVLKVSLVVVYFIYGLMVVATWWPGEPDASVVVKLITTALMVIPLILVVIVWAQNNELQSVRHDEHTE